MYRLNLALPETPSKPSALDTLKQQEPKTLWGPMQPLEAVGAAAVVEGAGMPAVIGTRKDRFLLRTTLPRPLPEKQLQKHDCQEKPESTAWRRPNRTAKLSKPTAPEYSPRVPPPPGPGKSRTQQLRRRLPKPQAARTRRDKAASAWGFRV